MSPLKQVVGSAALILLCLCATFAVGQPKNADRLSPAASDLSLQAMQQELERSKAQLKMENVAAPYYIEYHLWDINQYNADAAFGALRNDQLTHQRLVRVVVRVGDYKLDSYYGPGIGTVNLAPIDDDPIALRWQLWAATDQAYKAANEALAAKKAALQQYTSDQPFDDFAHASALQALEPIVKLDFDAKGVKGMLEAATAQYRSDPQMESLRAGVIFRAVNRYFVNSEGAIIRTGYTSYFVGAEGSTQAADGMRLERTPYYVATIVGELPTAERFESNVAKMIQTLKTLRTAPIVDEDYRGPVLFSADAASDIFAGMIGSNVLGIRPKLGDSARTRGDYGSNYKSRVLPTFLSVTDDPLQKEFGGKSLAGFYDIDDDGVRAAKVPVVQSGILVNYLLGREPIRDFPDSNGHGRAAPGAATTSATGILTVESKEPVSPEELKQKLIDICRQESKPFGYYVETLGAGYQPRLLYRVYEKDGHEELVRGAQFDELDTRALRNDLIAAGNDLRVSNREGAIPETIINPSILIDDLEVKRTDAKNAKLPEYPAPDPAPAR
jgi:TldD protein